MSGDCGHGWGYHHDGPSGPCYACERDETQKFLAELKALNEEAWADGIKNERLEAECKKLRERNARMAAAAREVLRISDRKHDAWDALKAELEGK